MKRILILEPDRYPERALAVLGSLGEVRKNQSHPPAAAELAEANFLIVRLKYFLGQEFLNLCPKLEVIVTATTGVDHIDLKLAEARRITVLSLRGETEFLNTVTATAEHAWGLLLALIRRIPAAHASVTAGGWDREPFFGTELQNRRLGIVGLGRIGKMVARYGLAFRMRVIAYDPLIREWVDGVERSESLPGLLRDCDVLSLHVPLNDETQGLIGRTELGLLPRQCVVINTSRGAILDQAALLEALESKQIAGAALDVIEDEYAGRQELSSRLTRYAASHQNLLLTPHIGGATHDSLKKVELFMAEKLARFVSGS